MSNDKSSLAKAMSDAAPEGFGVAALASAEQLDLLRDERGKLPANALQVVREERRGRPPGARNKRSKQVADWFVRQYGDPLAVFGELMNMPLDVLADQVRLAQGGENKAKPIRAIDMLRLKIQAAAEALPYVHGKQPIAVDVTVKDDAVIVIPGLIRGASPEEVAEAISHRGLSAIDQDTLELLPVDDAEYAECDEDDGDE